MKDIFLVFGYGVPKNILKDEAYNFYFKMIFNKIYDLVIRDNINRPFIIFSGGKTDCFKPYKRNEADEMIKFFRTLSKRPFLRKVTKAWFLIPEKKSLSTLENFLNCKKIISKRKIKQANLYIFCEQTREKRIKILAKKIFNKNYHCLIIPIDFDTSPNRYLDPKFIAKKERAELRHTSWALQGPENLKKHHKVFRGKIDYFRKSDLSKNPGIIKKWWEKKLKELER